MNASPGTKRRPIGLSFDVDCLDGAFVPGTGWLGPGRFRRALRGLGDAHLEAVGDRQDSGTRSLPTFTPGRGACQAPIPICTRCIAEGVAARKNVDQ